MVESELPEGVLLSWVLLRRFACGLYLVYTNRYTQGRVCFLPHLGVRPVVAFIGTIDDRIERGINLATFQDILGFLVCFVADRLGICSGSSNEEIQRLHSGVAGTLGHYIEQLPVRLSMQLVEDNSVDIEAVL